MRGDATLISRKVDYHVLFLKRLFLYKDLKMCLAISALRTNNFSSVFLKCSKIKIPCIK